MPRATVVYNPNAGQLNLGATIQLVADLWRARGWEVTLQPTERAGHATELARAAAVAGVEVLLAAGGDGTLGEVAQGLAETETILAPLPVGTANSFARELHLPRPTLFMPNRLLETADLLLDGRVQAIDLGYLTAEKRYWLLWAGAGADGILVEKIEPRPRWSKRLGKFGYLLQAVVAGWRLPGVETAVSIDGHTFSGTNLLVLLSNCRRYAGGDLLLNPKAQLDDGQLDVWLFAGQGLWQGLAYVWQIWRGQQQVAGVERKNGRFVTIQTTPTVPYQTDGDPAGHTPFTCELKPRALRLLVPQTTPRDLFCQPGQPLSQSFDAQQLGHI